MAIHGLLGIMKFSIPTCSECGMTNKMNYSDIVEKDSVACRFCGHSVSLVDPEWQNAFEQLVTGIREQNISSF